MTRRRKRLLAALTAASLVVIAIIMLNQPPSAPASQVTPIAPGEIPPSLLIVPEVPFGTIAIILACFLALLVVSRKSKIKPA